MEIDTYIDKFQKVNKMKKTWVEINHLLESNMEHNSIIWNVKDDGL
jgi:hypothetical protein